MEEHIRFHFVSENAYGLGIARRIREEGNEVTSWIRFLDAYSDYNGLVSKLQDWEVPRPDENTVRIYDTTGYGADCDLFRKLGVPTWGACDYADRLENDRKYAEDLARSIGFKVPESTAFDDIAAAKEFVKSHKGKLVLKPDGESSGLIPSCVPKGDKPDELLDILDRIDGTFIGTPKFLLQEFVPDAVEISTEAWFCGRLVRNLNHTLESKKMMDGESGATIGCAGNVVFPADNPIADRIWDCLSRLDATPAYGLLDVNCLVTEKELYWIEWTPRFGYDAAPAMFMKGVHGELGKLFSDLARGQLKSMPMLAHFSSALRCTIPPYPKLEDGFHPCPLRGVTLEDFYGYTVNQEEGQLMITNSEIGCTLGSGSTISEAMGKAVKVAEKIEIGQLQYRRDLDEKFQERYDQLITVGRVLEAA